MSADLTPSTPQPAAPSRWWGVLLVGSLALNLLVGGAVATRFIMGPPHERFTGASYTQLVPRRFLSDLDQERRRVLLDVLKQYRKDFSEGRKSAKLQSAKLADALEAEPYDVTKVEEAVKAYADGGTAMVAHGATAALDFISRLSPEERRMMAERLRQRAGMDDPPGPGSGGRPPQGD